MSKALALAGLLAMLWCAGCGGGHETPSGSMGRVSITIHWPEPPAVAGKQVNGRFIPLAAARVVVSFWNSEFPDGVRTLEFTEADVVDGQVHGSVELPPADDWEVWAYAENAAGETLMHGSTLVDVVVGQTTSASITLGMYGSGHIAFGSERYNTGDADCVWTMTGDGSYQTQLISPPTYGGSPSWSPDGSQIAFEGFDWSGNMDIYVMWWDGTGTRRLTYNSAKDTWPAWSPDGKAIAFTSERDGHWEIYLINPDGSNERRLTYQPQPAGLLEEGFGRMVWVPGTGNRKSAWSPTGQWVAYVSDRDGDTDVYRIRPDGTGEWEVIDTPDWENDPAWSPDGQRIAFRSGPDGNAGMEIYTMRAADGGDWQRLTYTSGFDGWPSWCPDGSALAFETEREGLMQIYVMNPDGTDQHNVSQSYYDDWGPSWGP